METAAGVLGAFVVQLRTRRRRYARSQARKARRIRARCGRVRVSRIPRLRRLALQLTQPASRGRVGVCHDEHLNIGDIMAPLGTKRSCGEKRGWGDEIKQMHGLSHFHLFQNR
jgi:hypothetical protein